jgi:hypothetical protein
LIGTYLVSDKLCLNLELMFMCVSKWVLETSGTHPRFVKLFTSMFYLWYPSCHLSMGLHWLGCLHLIWTSIGRWNSGISRRSYSGGKWYNIWFFVAHLCKGHVLKVKSFVFAKVVHSPTVST